MKKTVVCLLALALCLGLTACSGGPGSADDLTRTLKAGNDPCVYDGTAEPITRFGLSLMGEVAGQNGKNPVLSPLSAYLALAMTADGADGNTLRQFETLLGASGADRDALCQALSRALCETGGSTKLNLAQSVWTEEAAAISPEFLQQMVDVFSAEVFAADLDTGSAREAINRWVEERTEGLIPRLLDKNLQEHATMVLVNTLYFKGIWETEFEPNDTFQNDFSNEDGTTAQTDFLHRTDHIAVAEDDDWEGVLLPYDDGETAFLAMKPREDGNLRALTAALTAEQWQALLSGAAQEQVALAMPKLDAEYSINLNDTLNALGLTDAFDAERADFGKMGAGPEGYPLYIDTVLQKVRLKVAEEGTEAAAATAVIMAESAAAPIDEPRVMRFDAPYLYAVVDLDSRTPLFIGLATHL